jgi:hypothetical protein
MLSYFPFTIESRTFDLEGSSQSTKLASKLAGMKHNEMKGKKRFLQSCNISLTFPIHTSMLQRLLDL